MEMIFNYLRNLKTLLYNSGTIVQPREPAHPSCCPPNGGPQCHVLPLDPDQHPMTRRLCRMMNTSYNLRRGAWRGSVWKVTFGICSVRPLIFCNRFESMITVVLVIFARLLALLAASIFSLKVASSCNTQSFLRNPSVKSSMARLPNLSIRVHSLGFWMPSISCKASRCRRIAQLLAGVAGTCTGIDVELSFALLGSAVAALVNLPRILRRLKGIMPVALNADSIYLRV